MTDRHPERWDVSRRLRTSREYAALKSGAVALRGRHALLLALTRPDESTRVGFIASKRGVGGAVQRNRARRRLREIVRRRFAELPERGHWLAFVAYRSTLTATHEELVNDVESLLARAGTLTLSGRTDA
jgi:ribonuclease P protein component